MNDDVVDVINAMALGDLKGKDEKRKTMQLDGQSAMLPIDHNEDISKYFNMPGIQVNA